MTRSTRRLAFAFALAALACAGSSGSEQAEPLRREETQVMTMRARVAAVDLASRQVKLVDAAGRESVFYADEEVRNLPQVKVGDEVVGEYAQSIALEVREPTAAEREAGTSVLEVAARAEPGQKPSGTYVRQVTALLTIAAIDKAAQTATLRGPAGNLQVVKARNPANLDRVKVGDTVVATYTETLLLEVVGPASP